MHGRLSWHPRIHGGIIELSSGWLGAHVESDPNLGRTWSSTSGRTSARTRRRPPRRGNAVVRRAPRARAAAALARGRRPLSRSKPPIGSYGCHRRAISPATCPPLTSYYVVRHQRHPHFHTRADARRAPPSENSQLSGAACYATIVCSAVCTTPTTRPGDERVAMHGAVPCAAVRRWRARWRAAVGAAPCLKCSLVSPVHCVVTSSRTVSLISF